MKKLVLISVLLCGSITGLLQAQEILGFGADVSGSVELTYQSLYMWRGFNVFQDKSAVQLTADVKFAETGFGINVAGHRANSSGQELNERWDYSAYYQNKLFSSSPMVTNFRLGYVYYNYPDRSDRPLVNGVRTSEEADLDEIHLILAWPEMLGVKGLVPMYALVKLWPQDSGSAAGNASGFAHIFMMDYTFMIPGYTAEIPEIPIRFHSELVYNDGVDPRPGGPGVDHDWSDFVIGAATDIEVLDTITITPSVNYQISMERDVDTSNEFWATLGAKWMF